MEAEERPVKKRRLDDNSEDEVEEALDPDFVSRDIDTNVTTESPLQSNSVDHGEPEQIDHATRTESESQSSLPAPVETAPLAKEFNAQALPLSKNQQKKLRKHLEWESKREERKVKRKEKTIAKRERNRERRKDPAEHVEANGSLPTKRQRPVQLPVTILIDCAFDDLMRDQERKSLATQITRSYSDTRASLYRPHLAICSFIGELRKRFDEVLSHYKGWKGVRFLDCDFVDAVTKAKGWMLESGKGGHLAGSFSTLKSDDAEAQRSIENDGEIVYLTSEADDILTELKPYSTYIIGGLVDKNREKGVCYKQATKRGIKTARLPIGEFMDMQSRKVLTTNHVNEILLKWLECGDWGEAFVKVIPKRKGGMLKDGESGELNGDGGGEDAGGEDAEGGDAGGIDAGGIDASGVPDDAIELDSD